VYISDVMSRLGKLPIELPEGTTAKIEGGFIVVKGKLGELKIAMNDLVSIKIEDKQICVSVKKPEDKSQRSFWGLYRSLINNMVIGVNDGFTKKLDISGVGYRATVNGQKLILNLGYSHPIKYNIPQGIEVKVEDNIITISGIDKQLVGEVASQIRKTRKPEPYKGKGIKYDDEIVRRKVGKAAVKSE